MAKGLQTKRRKGDKVVFNAGTPHEITLTILDGCRGAARLLIEAGDLVTVTFQKKEAVSNGQ